MLRKFISVITFFVPVTFFAAAQNLEKVKHEIYYERFETAKDMLSDMIKAGDPDPDAFYLLGEIYMKQKNDTAAGNVLQKGLEFVATRGIAMQKAPLVHIGWAHLLLNNGRTTEAKQLITEVLKAGKNKDAAALYAAGRANIDSKNGEVSWAVEILTKAISRDKKNPFVYTAIADAYKKIIDGSNAVRYYDQALQADPSFAEAMYKKGKLYKSHNNPEVYLEKFRRAYEIDTSYAPALYELYYYYFYKDVIAAKKYLDAYTLHAEPSIKLDYMRTDLLYVSQEYVAAVESAVSILNEEKDLAQPRLYKLIAYSEASLGDSAAALRNIDLYFMKQQDTSVVAKDYKFKAKLLEATGNNKAEAITCYKKALELDKDTEERVGYMASLAELQKELGNREREAVWREQVYASKKKPTNLDLYKWGMALYSDENYSKADSVFAIYEEKYPDQIYGPLWRSKCNALIDTSMTLGLAVPHYIKLAEVASHDTEKNKEIMIRAYNYLGIYEANITKDYSASLGYFEKILTVAPENADALKFAGILKGWIEKAGADQTGKTTEPEKKSSLQAGISNN